MNKKRIIIILPSDAQMGQPSFERVRAFRDTFTKMGLFVVEVENPCSLREKWGLLQIIKNEQIKNIFISMPQFRNWWLFLLMDINIILDIRDGWSIAMRRGYGGTAKPKKGKAWLASRIEKFAMNRAALTVTCTPGLREYMQKLTKKRVLLILNGCSAKDIQTVKKLKSEVVVRKYPDRLVAICVGKFSEYGREKAEKILEKLSKAYINRDVLLRLVGSDYESNRWIEDYIQTKNLYNVRCKFLKRMTKENMYKQILMSDLAVTIIRDPDYDYGTKVFDYVLCDKPIFNYFDYANPFSEFFLTGKKELDTESSREELIAAQQNMIMKQIK